MTAKKDESGIVKIKDKDGRVHFTARGSAAHKRFEADGGKTEALTESKPADAAPAAG